MIDMITYTSLANVDTQQWKGQTYLWTDYGVYSFRSASVHRHKNITRPRQVEFWLTDTITGKSNHCVTTFPTDYDDWEIINRYVSGTGKCDCVRGQMMYGEGRDFSCNKRDNRFVITKMVIKGDGLNCVVNYKGYR